MHYAHSQSFNLEYVNYPANSANHSHISHPASEASLIKDTFCTWLFSADQQIGEKTESKGMGTEEISHLDNANLLGILFVFRFSPQWTTD